MSARLSPLSNGRSGFTLIEVLVAMAVLTIAVLGVGAAISVQSGGTAYGVSFGLGAVSRAGSVSTAAFLAQERLERVKRLNYTLSSDPFGPGPAPTGFPDEDFGSIAGYPTFSRQVRFWTGPPQAPAANIKLVTVTVSFQVPGDNGLHPENIVVSTLMAARP